MPKVISRIQCSLAIMTGAVILAASYSAVLLPDRQRDFTDLTRDSVVADVTGLMSDLARLGAAAALYRVAPEPRATGRVAQGFDAVRTGLAALERHHSDRIGSDPVAVAASLALDAAVVELEPLVAGLHDADAPAATAASARMSEIATSMEGSLGHVGSLAFNDLDSGIATAAASLRSAYDLSLALAAASVLCCLALASTFVRSNERLHRLARRDVLTGLQNRLTFSETLSTLLKDPGSGNEVALMLLDVDLFKNINDSLGHAAGDLLLKEIARRLSLLVAPGIYLSRLGGDEFAVVLAVRHSHRATSGMVEKIRLAMAQPVVLGSKSAIVGLSIGIALQSMHLSDAATMLKNADLALYAAKAAGRGRFRYFNARMDREFRGRREMEDDLRKAIGGGELELHFQPLVDLRTQAIVSCEALLRWKRPGHGYVPPMTFIHLAEEIGLIQEIGDWVLRQACAAAQAWPDDVRVSINLSPHQFDGDGFVACFTRILAETGLPPDRVELEITETLLLRDSAAVLKALAALRTLGVQIALDDFGTGYSSLSYLQRFSIDRIKIDQSFVRDMTRSPAASAIVESICLLAAKLDIATTGEGIETEADAALLRAFGCDEGQGYLFDRPMPLSACMTRLDEQRLRKAAA